MMENMSENGYLIGSVAFSFALLYLVMRNVNLSDKKQQISILIWVAIFAAVFMLAKMSEEPKVHVNTIQHTQDRSDNYSKELGHVIIRSKIARNGAYYLQASINGIYNSEFLVDTGATISIISKDSAEKAGINTNDFEKIIEVHTANGKMNAKCGFADIVIDPLTFPKLELCIAMHENLDKDILGTNFLDRFDSYSFAKNTLELVIDPKN